MRWFRMYAEWLHDPKVQSMTFEMQRHLVALFCVQCEQELGALSDDEVTVALRIDRHTASQVKEYFLQKKFINEDWRLRAWKKRQYQCDSSTVRTRKYRASLRRHCDVTVTVPDTDSDTDTDTEEKKKIEHGGAKRPRAKFEQPTLEQVKQLFMDREYSNPVGEADRFYNYYTSNGWRVGKNPMKDWKAAAANWNRSSEERSASRTIAPARRVAPRLPSLEGWKPPEGTE